MKKTIINKIKKLLIEEREELASKQDEIIDIDSAGDEIDIIQAKILANTEAQISAREKVRIKSIDLALKRISDNEFGNCEDCDEEISEKRLMFNPSFTKCIGCAEQDEAREKSRRF